MNWEALGAIGLVILALGILLYIPARIWVKHKLRAEPDAHAKLRFTKLGWALISTALLFLLGGFMMQFLAPESLLGQFVKTSSGRFLYTIAVALVFWLVEVVLKTQGVKLTKENNENENIWR